MRAFPTGSRIYGTPRVDSDYDLVIRISKEDAGFLLEASGEDRPQDYGPHSVSIKIGDLNIVACLTDESYTIWKSTTDFAKLKAPLTREESVHLFRNNLDYALS